MPLIPDPTSRKSVTLPEGMWNAIGEYRFYNRIPTEAEAIRQLIQKGLDLPHYLEAKRATIEILAGREKHYPGPFSAAVTDPFALIDLLSGEVQRVMSLGKEQATQLADAIFQKALEEAGADIDRARSLLNADWRRFAQ